MSKKAYPGDVIKIVEADQLSEYKVGDEFVVKSRMIGISLSFDDSCVLSETEKAILDVHYTIISR